MPEHNGEEILSDIDKFWEWFTDEFDGFVQSKRSGIKLDKEKLLVSGESAGGFLAAYTWLTQPKERAAIKALYLQYPMLCQYSREPGPYRQKIVNQPLCKEKIDKLIVQCTELRDEGTMKSVSSRTPPDGMACAYGLSSTKEWARVFHAQDIMQRLEEKTDQPATFPSVWIYHGMNDIQVPMSDTEKFMEVVQDKFQEMKGKFTFHAVPGMEHAGDCEKADERVDEYSWLKTMLTGLQHDWIGGN